MLVSYDFMPMLQKQLLFKNDLFSGPTIFPNVFQVGPEKMKVKDNLKDISTKSSPPGFLKGIFQSFPEEGYQPSTTALNIIHD